MRWLALLAVVAVGFAPAPLPRKRYGISDEAITLTRFQGRWRVLAMTYHPRDAEPRQYVNGIESVRVEGDRLGFYDKEGRLNLECRVAVRAAARPAEIDFFLGDRPYRIGVVGRHAGNVRLLYATRPDGARATDVAEPPADWWVLTLESWP